jgi:polysaccharide biosynthesis transport protein
MNAHAFDSTPDQQSGDITVVGPDSRRELGAAQAHSLDSVGRAYGYPNEQPESSFDLLRYWGLLLKYRWIFLVGAISAICIGYGMTFLATPIYRASATIEIDREAPKVVQLNNAQQEGETIGDVQFYQTEYELLKSRSLAAQVVADLDLANQPKLLGGDSVSPWTKLRQIFFGGGQSANKSDLSAREDVAIRAVMGGLSVQPILNSALVHLNFDSPSSEGAQAIVNAVSAAFIKSNLEHRYDATSYARNFLQDQLAQIRLKLEQSERELVAYAQKEQIVHLDGRQPLAAADLVAINSELAKVRADCIRNEQLWHQAEMTDGLGLPQILADQTIQALRNRRALLESDYYDKLLTFKPDFPDMKKLRAQINDVTREIGAAVNIIKKSIKATYDASLQQENLLVQQLKKNTEIVLDVQNRSIQYTILQREVDTNRALYNALLQRYKDVGVAGGVGTNNISVVDPAQLPTTRFSPSLKKNLSIALVLGLMVSASVAYILELLDDTFKTPEQVEEFLQMPVLGLTPLISKDLTLKDAQEDPHSALSEAFRSVRTALQFSTDAGVPKTLLVTSSRPAEGKSTVSLALARNFAQLGLKVLLIDADLRNPSLHKTLECENTAGLSNYLAGGNWSPNTFHKTATAGLAFLATGPLPPNPAELLASQKMLSLLTVLQQRFDLIILDGPPVIGIADALLLSSVAAGTLMVVSACDTRRGVVKGALKRLHFARARMVGALLSKFDARKVGFAYGYSYGYGYGGTDFYGYGTDTPKLAKTPSE